MDDVALETTTFESLPPGIVLHVFGSLPRLDLYVACFLPKASRKLATKAFIARLRKLQVEETDVEAFLAFLYEFANGHERIGQAQTDTSAPAAGYASQGYHPTLSVPSRSILQAGYLGAPCTDASGHSHQRSRAQFWMTCLRSSKLLTTFRLILRKSLRCLDFVQKWSALLKAEVTMFPRDAAQLFQEAKTMELTNPSVFGDSGMMSCVASVLWPCPLDAVIQSLSDSHFSWYDCGAILAEAKYDVDGPDLVLAIRQMFDSWFEGEEPSFDEDQLEFLRGLVSHPDTALKSCHLC